MTALMWLCCVFWLSCSTAALVYLLRCIYDGVLMDGHIDVGEALLAAACALATVLLGPLALWFLCGEQISGAATRTFDTITSIKLWERKRDG